MGATDSLVSCAMMLEFAKLINNNPNYQKDVELVFFDGEEAFGEWTRTDSLYGSRKMAEQMDSENKIKDIKVMILFDLVGEAGQSFYNLMANFKDGGDKYFKFLSISETELLSQKKLLSKHKYFKNQRYDVFIEDDHLPFYERNVPILHLIPHQFPRFWHSQFDNFENISWECIQDIFQIFIYSLNQIIVN